jgi:hypothetical protein
MTKKIFSLTLGLFLVAASFVAVQKASADTYPAGCSSILGSSVTTGTACNGTTTPTPIIAGCTSAVGYSATTGVACSGTSVALQYLGGCTSIYGYSAATGQPCNGTTVALVDPSTIGTVTGVTMPGLPTTAGSDNLATNLAILASAGALALVGSIYLSRRSKIAIR